MQDGGCTWRDRGLDDCNFEIRTGFTKHVSRTQSTRASADDYNVAFGVGVQVVEVAASHGPGHLALADGSELERLPFICEIVENFGLGIDLYVTDGAIGAVCSIDCFRGQGGHGRQDFSSCWWRHGCAGSG